MGVLSHKVKKEEIKPGDHIYTYRAAYTYSHHGIYVGGSRVIHFTLDQNRYLSTPSGSSFNPTSWVSSLCSSFNHTTCVSSSSPSFNHTSRVSSLSSSFDYTTDVPSLCPNFPCCGFRLPNNGVTISCLDCFLRSGSPRLYQYGVSKIAFLVKARGGTCTMAKSDPLETVFHRAICCLLQIGFGNYDLMRNNCEDFALYCKTGLMDRHGSGNSGQSSSLVAAKAAVVGSIPVIMWASSPVGAVTSVGLHCWTCYKTYRSDIGVSRNVVEVPVEDLAAKFDCKDEGEVPKSRAYQVKLNACPEKQNYPRTVKVELPVRVDFVGGWSDTPPWSLERAGCVLNMAICLEDTLPIGTIINTTWSAGVSISDDDGNDLFIQDLTSIAPPFETDDPFRLVKCALLVTEINHDRNLQNMGLEIKTWANVPCGSGLGTSSILAAAVVKGLLQIIDGDDGNENVARLVLVLEQLMGTGGGWQDQIGGLYPGIKFTTSFPGIPLQLLVVPLLASPELKLELQQRLLVVFTGQVRLARKVLQNVVTRYLRWDNLLVSSIKRLAELAKLGTEALMNSDIDELGNIMMEAWRLHQELDPFCSNQFVDRLFEFVDPYCCGYKLVGAGGGGFALLLARDSDSAVKLRWLLTNCSLFDVKVYNWSISSEQ